MRKVDADPDDLNRPEWNSLVNNYDLHDVGEAYFKEIIEDQGLIVENWGIDKRHHDDGLIFDNKMDLRLWEASHDQTQSPTDPKLDETVTETWDIGLDSVERTWNLCGVADIKTKSNESWFGRFNVRHLAHYTEWADHYDVPVFVYMTIVDKDNGEVGDKEFACPITTEWDWQSLVDHYNSDSNTNLTYGDIKDVTRECDIVKRVFRAPDGNLVLDIEKSYRHSFDWIFSEVL